MISTLRYGKEAKQCCQNVLFTPRKALNPRDSEWRRGVRDAQTAQKCAVVTYKHCFNSGVIARDQKYCMKSRWKFLHLKQTKRRKKPGISARYKLFCCLAFLKSNKVFPITLK